MQPDLSLFSIIMLLGAAHGLFLALTLINTRDAKGTGRLFLAILTLALAIDLGHEFLYQSRYLLNVKMLAYADPIVNLIYGPSFYLYFLVLTKGVSFKLTKIQALHLLPATLAVFVCSLLPELSESQFIHLFYNEDLANSNDEILVRTTISRIALASVFFIGCYLFLCFRLLILHAKLVRQQFSDIEKITLNWLRTLLLAISAIYFILIVDGFFSDIIEVHDNVNNLLYLMIVTVIYTMGYMGLKQPAIFSNREPAPGSENISPLSGPSLNDTENHSTEKKEPKADNKYKTSSLDSSMSEALKEDLQRYMKAEKPYLESQLTLPQLAKQLGISPNYLSQVINEQLQMNFFDFINEYRVAEAKFLLTSDKTKNTAVINVAYGSGFNSKSAFYSAFKKHVNITPSEFRKLDHTNSE